MITVFYDGQCGLCSKEINYFKQQPTPANFNWQFKRLPHCQLALKKDQ